MTTKKKTRKNGKWKKQKLQTFYHKRPFPAPSNAIRSDAKLSILYFCFKIERKKIVENSFVLLGFIFLVRNWFVLDGINFGHRTNFERILLKRRHRGRHKYKPVHRDRRSARENCFTFTSISAPSLAII